MCFGNKFQNLFFSLPFLCDSCNAFNELAQPWLWWRRRQSNSRGTMFTVHMRILLLVSVTDATRHGQRCSSSFQSRNQAAWLLILVSRVVCHIANDSLYVLSFYRAILWIVVKIKNGQTDYRICLLLCSTIHRYMKTIWLFPVSGRSTKLKH